MSLKIAVIKWTGKYSYEQVCESDKSKGIYLFVGKLKYERDSQIQYCGITEDYFCNRISDKHHKLGQVRKDTLSIWLGEIIYPTSFNRTLLELAEHCFVSFWQPTLNDKKRIITRVIQYVLFHNGLGRMTNLICVALQIKTIARCSVVG